MMVLLLKDAHLGYNQLMDLSDLSLADYPLMGSPLPILTIFLSYILFVLKIGPSFMKYRNPYNLTTIIMGYNLIQVVVNILIVYKGLKYIPEADIFCTPVGNFNLAFCTYLYFWIKILDLFDTVFFVLRKKSNQITFLHLYHHIVMLLLTWAVCKFYPGGQVYFVGSINGFIHVVMYFYYFLTAWDAKYKKSMWWKKHLTELQLVQHCSVFIIFLLPLINPDCSYSKSALAAFLLLTVLMIYLFVRFYLSAYIRKESLIKAAKE